MKKILYLLCMTIITSMLFTGCGRTQSESPSPSNPAVTSPVVTAVPESSTEIPESTPVPAETTNSSTNSDEHTEIAKMIKDAQELIDEDLIDDANMLIRDLLTRDLTEEEKSQVDALKAKIVKISD